MRVIYLLILCGILQACSNASSPQDEQANSAQTELIAAIEQAKLHKDFRLLATQGRRMAIPGIEPQQAASYIKRCGIKLMKQTGDVLKTQQQKQQRLEQLEFASQYNQQVLSLCQQQ